MQNRYVADIGDYGKYGLLSFICKNTGLHLGVNWYLVNPEEVGENENSDGNKTQYLKSEKYMKYDQDIFNGLKNIITEDKRTVHEIQNRHILPKPTIFYSEPLSYYSKEDKKPLTNAKDRKAARDSWFEKSLQRLKGCDIVFLDPDNGIKPLKTKEYRKKGVKYVFKEEIEKYYYSGKSLIVYNHKSMEVDKKYRERFNFIKNLTKHDNIPCLRFHKGGTRDYIFVLYPDQEHRGKIKTALDKFLETDWKECFRYLTL